MRASLPYVLGSLGALNAFFGAFVLLRAGHQETGPDPWLEAAAARACRAFILLGSAAFALALLLP